MPIAFRTFARPNSRWAAGIAVVSLLALTSALVLQYGFGFAPCELCLWQRWPYLASIAALVLGLLLDRPRAALLVAALSFAVGAALAGYHYGVEEGLFALPEGCLAGEKAQSLDHLRQMLAAAPPRCDQASLLLGYSLAFWNLGLSLLLVGVSLFGARFTPSGNIALSS